MEKSKSLKALLPLLVMMLVLACCGGHQNREQTEEAMPMVDTASWQGSERIGNSSFRLLSDTLRQGGLVLLHNIAIVDDSCHLLFADSIGDYEPDHCTLENDGCRIVLMPFDPCSDLRLWLRVDNGRISEQRLVSMDTISSTADD